MYNRLGHSWKKKNPRKSDTGKIFEECSSYRTLTSKFLENKQIRKFVQKRKQCIR